MAMIPDLVRREQATNQTLLKFRYKAFDWAAGITCVHLARFQLWKMGHRVEPMPRVRSLLGANRALQLRGWKDCADLLDGQPLLARIAPAQMLLGDLAVLDSDAGGIGSIFIWDGHSMLMGWREDSETMINLSLAAADFAHVRGAWRL